MGKDNESNNTAAMQEMLATMVATMADLRKQVSEMSGGNREIVREEVAGAFAKRKQDDLPKTKLGDIFAKYRRVIIDGNAGTPAERPDARQMLAHMILILRLPFEFEDETIVLRDLPCNRLTGEMVKAWRDKLINTPKSWKQGLPWEEGEPRRCAIKRNKSPSYKGSSVDRVVSTFQTIMKWAVGKSRTPLVGVERFREKTHREGYFADEAQFEAFLKGARPLLADILRLSVNAGGMRAGEVRGLLISEVNWRERMINLPAERTKARKPRSFPVRYLCRKHAKPVCPECGEMEFSILLRRRVAADAIGSPYVFPDPAASPPRPVHASTLCNWMRAASEKWEQTFVSKADARLNGGERPVMHHARHTYATWAAAKGVRLESIKRNGGWESDEIVMRYMKTTPDIIESDRNAMGRTIQDVRDAATKLSTARGKIEDEEDDDE